MKEIVFYAATSIDNRISDKFNSVKWLDEVNLEFTNLSDDNPIKQSYPNFYQDVDMIVMGSKTYDEVSSMDFEYPYSDKENYVITSKSDYSDPNVTNFINYEQLLTILRESNAQKIWICGGANLFNQLLADKLITRIILTQIPIILGCGARLFNNLEEVKLDLVRVTEAMPYLELEYEIKY